MEEFKQEKPHLWNEAKKMAEIGLFSLFLALTPGSSSAKDLKGINDMRDAVNSQSSNMNDMRDAVISQSETNHEKLIGKLQSEIIQKQNSIKKMVDLEGSPINFNGESAKEWINRNGDVIILGNGDGGKKWLLLTSSNKVITYFDEGNGLPDSVFMNRTQDNSNLNIEANELLEKLVNATPDLDMSSVMINTVTAPSKDLAILKFKQEGGGVVIDTLNLGSGYRSKATGKEAIDAMGRTYEYYLDHLNSI